MPEIEEDFVIGTLKGSELVDMKTNLLCANTESENTIIEKKHTEQRSTTTNSGLENAGH